MAGIVRDAIASDELTLPDCITSEDLVFGLWSMTSGAYSIALTSESLVQLGVSDAYETVRHHIGVFLDGYGWTPLSTQYCRNEKIERIDREIFPNE